MDAVTAEITTYYYWNDYSGIAYTSWIENNDKKNK
jgi:hypothetical protein